MTRSIQLTEPAGALLPDEHRYNDMMRMADNIAKSGLVPNVQSPAAVITLMQTGRELGIPSMAAVHGLHIIKGRPTPSARLIDALIRRDHGGGALRISKITSDECTIKYRRREWEPGEYDEFTYTMEDAERAGYLAKKTDNNWVMRPKNMLRARAISEVARMAFADSLMGMYSGMDAGPMVDLTPDERMQHHMKQDQDEMLDELVSDIVDAEVREVGEVIVDPPASDNEYQPYIQTDDIETDYQEIKLRINNAPTYDVLALVWEDVKRVGFARDPEITAAKDEKKQILERIAAEDQAVTA